MTPEEFITAVEKYVRDSAVSGVQKQLEKPAGRSPRQSVLERSEWYNSLSAEDQAMVREVAKEGADAALFGLFCVLDGARLIDQRLRDGRLQLVFEGEDRSVISDNQALSDLHDLFNMD